MVAMAITLLMMLSLSQIFKIIGDSMQRGRAIMELNNRLRTVTHRLRTDLAHLTLTPRPPTDPSSGAGYFKYYDGPMTDFTSLSTGASRIGDCDDIIMGTIKARDTWFTGKVPRFILERRIPTSEADLTDTVTIASQYAEMIVFAQPLVAISKPTAAPPLTGATVNASRDSSYLVADSNFFQDDDQDGIPDSYRLHYRLLLIRPDLNLAPLDAPVVAGNAPAGALPGNPSTAPPLFMATTARASIPGVFDFALQSPHFDMTMVHALCDLSVRRVFNSISGTPDFVAANSMADLVAPENRFAHVQARVPNTNSTTMPVLALAPTIPHLATNPHYHGGLVGSGFLHPAFVLQGDRMGEDVLATDILAFDVKAFDEGVPLLLRRGTNGLPQAGQAGSDDLVLSPNDPGYAALAQVATPATIVGTGEFVDLAWGHKARAEGLGLASGANIFTQLSGLSTNNVYNIAGFTDTLLRSGQVLSLNPENHLVVQPAFDTWSTHYEGDGVLQSLRNGMQGVVRINGYRDLYNNAAGDDTNAAFPAWRQTAIDAGTDNLDNPGSFLGVDDATESETAAPFNVPIRGIKVTIRMEDPKTRQVRQMSVVREFVNQ
jgi:hypothetical protein